MPISYIVQHGTTTALIVPLFLVRIVFLTKMIYIHLPSPGWNTRAWHHMCNFYIAVHHPSHLHAYCTFTHTPNHVLNILFPSLLLQLYLTLQNTLKASFTTWSLIPQKQVLAFSILWCFMLSHEIPWWPMVSLALSCRFLMSQWCFMMSNYVSCMVLDDVPCCQILYRGYVADQVWCVNTSILVSRCGEAVNRACSCARNWRLIGLTNYISHSVAFLLLWYLHKSDFHIWQLNINRHGSLVHFPFYFVIGMPTHSNTGF